MIDAFTRLRSRRHQLTWLVLPALLLRALIPAGFMPFAGPGGAYLGLCPGAGSLAPSALIGHGHHHHVAEEGGTPGAPSGGHHHPACIFSLGATSAAAATVLLVSAIPAPRAPADRADSLVILPPILRAQSSRAPPPAA